MDVPVFVQSAPQPGNSWDSDWLLRSLLERKLPPTMYARIEPELRELGALAAGPLRALQLADRLNEPRFTPWSAWGERIDHVEVTALWHEAERLTVKFGLTAIPYERRDGEWSRTHQFALVHLFHPVTDVYTCPLAMTDGAARTLLESGNRELCDRALPRLTSRDPARFWTSGQWMTESTGGSDVGSSTTVARRDEQGAWRLYGKKWFTSAAASQMALTLARPEGGKPGGSGLAMFYVETRDDAGRMRGMRIERLKDKLGTRKVPTAELTLEGAPAVLVGADSGGTRAIEPMLGVTRMWNSVCAESFMRHGLDLARDYAKRRHAFGTTLDEQPLHRRTLAGLEAEAGGAFLLTFLLIELVGRAEAGQLEPDEAALLRILTPLTKLVTGKQSVQVVSEVIEAFGGQGYIEDTGLPVLLRDTQVLPIWEGTTNVLALDLLLRADLARGLPALAARIAAAARRVDELGDTLGETGRRDCSYAVALAARVVERQQRWLEQTADRDELQAGARRLALTIGRALELALLAEHAVAAPRPDDRAAAHALCVGFCRDSLLAV